MINNIFYQIGIVVGFVTLIVFGIRIIWDGLKLKLKKAVYLDAIFILLGALLIVVNLRLMHYFYNHITWTLIVSLGTLFYAFLFTYSIGIAYDLLYTIVNNKHIKNN